MWLAHALTLSRIPLAIALWSTAGHPAWSSALVVLAALTDAADGNVARWMQRRGHSRPDIGGWLDPLVDKLFVAIVLAAVWIRADQPLAVLLIGARELVLLPLAAIYASRRPPASELRAAPIGKAATVAQFVALVVVFAAPAWTLPAAIAAAALGLAAVAHYAAHLPPRRRRRR